MIQNRRYDIFDKMIEGVQIVSPDFEYLYVNDTVVYHAKSTREELVGFKMMEKFPGIENTEMFKIIKKTLENKDVNVLINEFDFPDGSKGYFELRMQYIEEGVIIFSHDITDQKRAEVVIQEDNINLEKKVQERTEELISNKEQIENNLNELKALEKQKDELLQIIVSELKTPLSFIRYYYNQISNHIQSIQNEFIRDLDSKVLSTIENSINLSDKLILWANIKSEKIKPVKINTDICYVIENILEELKDLINKKNVKITKQFDSSDLVYCDIENLRFSLRIIIENSIVYNKDNGMVLIKYLKKDNKNILEIYDTGIGINSEKLENLFSLNSLNVEDNKKSFDLILTKLLLDKNNIDLEVSSDIGQGSEFKLIFN